MSPRLPRRVLPTIALIAALALPIPAQAATLRNSSSGPAVLEDFAETFRHWFAHLWSRTFEQNGAQTDPDGHTNDNGAQIDPDGRTARTDNGAQIDPNG